MIQIMEKKSQNKVREIGSVRAEGQGEPLKKDTFERKYKEIDTHLRKDHSRQRKPHVQRPPGGSRPGLFEEQPRGQQGRSPVSRRSES